MYLSDNHTNKIFSRRIFFLTKQTFYETNLPRNVIEKYYTWVDVQFLILVSSLPRDFILSFVSYNLIRGNIFYRILVYFNCAICTRHNVYCIFMNYCFVYICIYVIEGHLVDWLN